jgi:hypothetical protein
VKWCAALLRSTENTKNNDNNDDNDDNDAMKDDDSSQHEQQQQQLRDKAAQLIDNIDIEQCDATAANQLQQITWQEAVQHYEKQHYTSAIEWLRRCETLLAADDCERRARCYRLSALSALAGDNVDDARRHIDVAEDLDVVANPFTAIVSFQVGCCCCCECFSCQ